MSGTPYTVLLVEDDYSLRKSLQLSLKKYQLRTLEASNGQEALEIFREHRVDGVVLDALMPLMDGFETCREIRKLDGGEEIPILLITGLNDAASIDRAYNCGATDYILKPIHLGVLSHRLLRLIQAVNLELALHRKRTEFDAIYEAIPDAVVMADPERAILTCNPAFIRRFGYQAKEVIGEFTQILYADPDDFENEDERLFSPAVEGSEPTGLPEIEYRCRDGGTFFGETTGSVVLGKDGEKLGYLHIIRDVTERRRAEEERLKADKLATMGLLAGGIAHDFNNIMTALGMSLSNVRAELPENSPASAYLAECMPVLDQATHLSKQLLTFAKGGAPIKKMVNLASLVRETVSFSLRATQSVADFEVDSNIWPAEADDGQIVQVVSNLVINADQALGSGGTVTVRVRNCQLQEASVESLKAGPYVRIDIADCGPGIGAEVLPHIFDPYFTTKKTGSGLGLATSFSIISKHGGHIEVESEPGKGTEFRIYLPACPEGKLPDPQQELVLATATGRILMLEDQEVIRRGVTRLLEREHYEVVCFERGEEAVEGYGAEFHGPGPGFDMLILDMTIPGGMNGLETLRRIRGIDPSIPAIVSSGYWDDPVMASPAEYGFQGVLPKPFTRDELLRVVTDILGKVPERS